MNVNAPYVKPFQNDAVPLQEWLSHGKSWIESALGEALPAADQRPRILHEAMRYACLGGGKRLRGILAMTICQTLGAEARRALRPALALEAFHAYTLIHDDLPCMDDDDIRRGKPATHIQFGEANALLAGDALLTLACQWLAETHAPLPHPPAALVTELTTAGGSQGVIGGQVEDLAAETLPPDEEMLVYIHTEKTARLIACACRMGAISAGACASKVDLLGRYGLHLGLAFQMIDDLLDATADTRALGKPAGSDAKNQKLTTVRLWGLEKSRAEAERHTRMALDLLEQLECPAGRLQDLTRHLLMRDF
ncbi:MAG: polyprenyl synthetase family protein [Verrucomicrobia bacterium]|nr:polyprenyl synthetase family protein [Verrucomicrobiota bacterium]